MNFNTDTHTANFVNYLFSKQFLPYIIHPSHVPDKSSTLIDNISTNICDPETLSGNVLVQITDKFPQFLILKNADIKCKDFSYDLHDFSNLNQEHLCIDSENIDMTYSNSSHLDVNAKFNQLLSNLDELIKSHVPQKKLFKKDIKFRNKPWINSRI